MTVYVTRYNAGITGQAQCTYGAPKANQSELTSGGSITATDTEIWEIWCDAQHTLTLAGRTYKIPIGYVKVHGARKGEVLGVSA